jgi:tetratricopeptide (TPR) repeat protein
MTTTIKLLAATALAAGLAPALAQDKAEVSDKLLALNSVTGDKAMVAKITELRKDKPGLKALLAEAKSAVKDKEKDPPLNFTACYVLARAAHMTRDFEPAEAFYKLCVEHAFKLKSSRKLAQVFEGLIDLFERTKKYDDALFICDKFLGLKGENERDEIERAKPFILEQKIIILARQQKFDDALQRVDELIRLDEGGWYFVRRKAEVLREAGQFRESAAAYEDAIERINANDNIKDEDRKRFLATCKFLLSSVYVDLDELDKSVEIMEGLIKDYPDNATYQNDLGYILADHNQRLDDALKMIEKALELDRAERKRLLDEGLISAEEDRDNSAYLDSLAWVHFRKKNYDKALELMTEVVKQEESQHPEIYDHLGDIYKAKGQTDEAVKAWKKALALENVNHRDVERKKAIRKKIAANDGKD